MTNAPSVDIKDVLVTDGIGTFGGTTGWAIFISEEPNKPDQVVTIFDSGGFEANPKFILDFPTLQINIRGKEDDYTGTYAKALAVKDSLLGDVPGVINGTDYIGIWQIGDINYISRDDSNRPFFNTIWRIVREPASGGNRIALT